MFCVAMAIAATLLYFVDLSGGLSASRHVDRDELLLLGLGLAGLVAWFGLRRIFEQERQIARTVAAEAEARHLADHDQLTGLPNRRGLHRALDGALGAPPAGARTHALLLFDLNGFKRINDLHGHGRGDAVLEVVARRMSGARRTGDTLARMGGDEFALVVRDVANAGEVARIADHIADSLAKPIAIGDDTYSVSTGIGAALIPAQGRTAEILMRKADVALYRAKGAKEPVGTRLVLFDEAIERETLAREQLARDLAAAMEDGAVVPHYQPIVDLATGSIRAFEALARWTHPTLGAIPPDTFIPLAEESGLIHALSDQLLRRACEDAACWPAPIRLSFNISQMQLRDETLGLRILRIVGDTKFALHRLELEITEAAVAADLELASANLGMLRDAGLRIVLDDFGAGATTLDHLRRLCFDGVKIDRKFVEKITSERESASIVRAVIDLAQGLGLDVVAEGIEDLAQNAMLRADGCVQGQGFLFSRAVAFDDTLALLAPRRSAEAG